MKIYNTKKDIKNFLSVTKHWNGNRGLIIPQYLGKILSKNGFNEKDGYIVSQNLPANKLEK